MELTVLDLGKCLREEGRRVQLRLDWLRESGLVEHEKCGRYHCYRVVVAKRPFLDRLFGEYEDALAWSQTHQLDRRRVRACFSRRDAKGI